MMDSNMDYMRKSVLFQGLDKKEFRKIRAAFTPTVRTYEKQEIILRQGDTVGQVGILLEGRVTGVKYHHDGSSQLLKFLNPFDIIGLESAFSSFLTSPYMLIADNQCSILFFMYKKLFDSQEIPLSCKVQLLQNVIHVLSDENIRLMYKIDTLSKRTLRERILTYLSIMREKRGTDTFDIGMTQEQFALYLCVNRSVLSNELNKMRREKLIDFKKSTYTLLTPSISQG